MAMSHLRVLVALACCLLATACAPKYGCEEWKEVAVVRDGVVQQIELLPTEALVEINDRLESLGPGWECRVSRPVGEYGERCDCGRWVDNSAVVYELEYHSDDSVDNHLYGHTYLRHYAREGR